MKKIFVMMMILICALSFASITFAEGEYANIGEMYQDWAMNGYPDYVGSVYSTDGSSDNMTILLIEGEETKADEIRALLKDDSGVSFGVATYAHNELKEVNNEIVKKYMGSDAMIYGVGIGWTSVDGEVTGFGESKKESRVIVTVDDSIAQEYANQFYEIYGDMVIVEAGGAAVPLSESTKQAGDSNTWTIVAIIGLSGILMAAFILLKRQRFIPAMQTNSGNIVTGDTCLSRKQTIKAIKNSEFKPDKDMLKSIMKQINK